MPLKCRLCTIIIGEGYYNTAPYYLKIKGEDTPFCLECYKEMLPMSGWARIREIVKEDYIRLVGDLEDEEEKKENTSPETN